MSKTEPCLRLVDRLRGIYILPVIGEPLNGKDTFTQSYEVTPISKEAADEIERLQSVNTDLLEALLKIRAYLSRRHSPFAVEMDFPYISAAITKATGDQHGT